MPDRGPLRAASAGGGPGAGPGRLAGSRRSHRDGRGGCARGQDSGSSEPRHCTGRPRRIPQHTSAGAAAAAAEGREGAKYRAHAIPIHTHTSPPKPYPPKAAFLTGETRHDRPLAPERTPPGFTLPQLRRQQDARRVIREGGDSAHAGQGASHGSAERGTGGDRGGPQGQTQGAGLGARGKERGRKRGQCAEASGSGRGQSAGSGRHDAGQGAGKGQGHGKDTQGREQGAKAGGLGAHGVERGVVSERGRSQGHGHGHGKGTGAGSAGQGASDRERDPRRGQADKGVRGGKGPKGKGKGAVGPQGQTGQGTGATRGGRSGGRGTGGGAPPQLDVQPVRFILPGTQQMLAHHTHHHHHHQTYLYNIDPDAGDLIPPQPA